ncbi:pitrilysin family protein [soil metagenome]
MPRTLAVALALLTVPLFAAEPVAPLDPKLIATAKSIFKDIRTETLPNGLAVYMLPVPGAPVVTTMVAYKVGAGDELKDQTGLSHYLEHLLFKGTSKYFPGDIDRATQRNGGHNNAYTNEDMTVYHFDFAADRWMLALEIEADRMRNVKIDEKHEFQQEKGAVISELKGGEDRPWELEQKAILPRLFAKTDPYSHPVIGEEDHVRAATAEVIKRHYDKWYHPNNASLVIVGGFDPDVALAKVKELFGSIPKSDLPERVATPGPVKREKQIRHEFESKFDAPRILVGFNTVAVGDTDEITFDVIQQILSGGRTSRLYRKLIDGEQIAAEVDAGNQAGRYPGWFSVQMEVLSGRDRKKAEAMLFEELTKLAKEPVTADELLRVKQGLLAAYIFGREDIHSLCDQIASTVTNKNLAYLSTYLDKVLAITAEDVQRVAAKYLNANSAVVVWSLPVVEPKGGGDEKPKKPKRIAENRAVEKAEAAAGAGGFKLTDAKKVVLPNGIKLIMLENHRLPIIVATASVAHTHLREPAEKAGVATLVGDLLEEGSDKHTGEEIAAMIENVGGTLGFSNSGGSLKVLTPNTDLGLGLLFECLMKPAFKQERFDAQREQLLAVIAAEETEPLKRARNAFSAAIYGKHPLGRPSDGTSKTVGKLKPEDCKAFHAETFVPNNTTVVVVGDFDAAAMEKKIVELTKEWKSKDLAKLDIAAPLVPEKPVTKIITDKTAAQTHVLIGHLGITRDNPDYYKLLVMDNVLGTGPGFTDRLSASLRDRQGLAYTVRATIADSASEQPGTFTGYIGTFPDKFTWVRDGFLKEFNKIRDEQPSDQEVDDAKRYLLGSMPFRLTTSGHVAGELLAAEKYGLGFDTFEKFKTAIAAVTPADVQAVAKKHLDPNRIVIVAVGPIDKEGQALKAKKGAKK